MHEEGKLLYQTQRVLCVQEGRSLQCVLSLRRISRKCSFGDRSQMMRALASPLKTLREQWLMRFVDPSERDLGSVNGWEQGKAVGDVDRGRSPMI